MAKPTMPAKRKYSNVTPNAVPARILPPAPQKPGKLKSILKRPSPASRFSISTPTSTPSAQIKLEFRAATHGSNVDQPGVLVESSAASEVPSTAKKPKLEPVSTTKAERSTASQHIPSADPNQDIIEDSAAETELPKPQCKKFTSPKYEGDGDTEDLVTDSQREIAQSDVSHLMSGGLGPGESPYKRTPKVNSAKTSPRKSKKSKKKKNVRTLEFASVSPPAKIPSEVKCEQMTLSAPKMEPPFAKGNVLAKSKHPASSTSKVVNPHPEQGPDTKAGSKPDGALPALPNGKPVSGTPEESAMEQKTTAPRINNIIAAPVCVSTPVAQSQSGPLTPAGPKLSRMERRKSSRRESPVPHIMEMLQEHEKQRDEDMKELQRKLRAALERTAHIKTQNDMLLSELASQSKDRQLPLSWHLNTFAIFSRRTYSLRNEEETTVVAGCDDLEEANAVARDLFQKEMSKLGSVVEDLGQVQAFCGVENHGFPQVQMRSTSCGLLKCRSYQPDSQWELTVDRVATN